MCYFIFRKYANPRQFPPKYGKKESLDHEKTVKAFFDAVFILFPAGADDPVLLQKLHPPVSDFYGLGGIVVRGASGGLLPVFQNTVHPRDGQKIRLFFQVRVAPRQLPRRGKDGFQQAVSRFPGSGRPPRRSSAARCGTPPWRTARPMSPAQYPSPNPRFYLPARRGAPAKITYLPVPYPSPDSRLLYQILPYWAEKIKTVRDVGGSPLKNVKYFSLFY